MAKKKRTATDELDGGVNWEEENDQELVDQARRGNLEWVESLLSTGAIGRLGEALEEAALSNHADCVRAILPRYGEPDLNLMERVAASGGAEALSALLSARNDMPEWTLLHLAHLARASGHPDAAERAEARWEADALRRETPHAQPSAKLRL